MTENYLLREILEQPDALRRVHQAYIARRDPALQSAAGLLRRSPLVVLAGMATSEYAGYAASGLLNQNGKVSFVYDVSELLYYHLPSLLRQDTCLVLVSQSGNSAEVVHLLEELRGRVPVVGVFNNEDSALAQACDIPLPMVAGPQLACGSKTNLSSVAILNLLATAALEGDLQTAGEHLLAAAAAIERFLDGWEAKVAPLVEFLDGAPYTVFLGRGPARASAMFTATLFREVPKVVAEGMGAAAFRHGLREMIRPEHRAVLFAPQGQTHELLFGLAKDLHAIAVPVLLATNTADEIPGVQTLRLEALPELWSPLLDMVPLQLAGYRLAERRGLEPGVLLISSYVTTVE